MPIVKYKSPLGYATIIIILTAMVAEGIGMLIIHHTGTPHSALVYLDSLLIVGILLPVVYFVIYQPMTTYINSDPTIEFGK